MSNAHGPSPHNTQRITIIEKLPANARDATDSFVASIQRAIDFKQPIRVNAGGKEYLLDPIGIEVE